MLRRRSSALLSLPGSPKRDSIKQSTPIGFIASRTRRAYKDIFLILLLVALACLGIARWTSRSIERTSWPVASDGAVFNTKLCTACNESTHPGGFAQNNNFTQIALLDRTQVRKKRASAAEVTRYLVHNIVLYPVFQRVWLNIETVAKLLTTYLSDPDSMVAYSFHGLKVDVPTFYLYTRTGPGGRLPNIEKRLAFFSRHIAMLKQYNALLEEDGHRDGTPVDQRQLLWIVVEDESHINDDLASHLHDSSIPYLYFAHGPTRWLGVAQWNAVERAVHVLRDTFFGDGPVMNLDDDAKFEPDLLRRVWRVKRAITWPVGNLPSVDVLPFPEYAMWEGLICTNGAQDHWRIGGLPNRVFPLDMNGFAINSQMVGTGRAVSPPQYVPKGEMGAETSFLEQIYSNRSEIECICDNTYAEGCFQAWHNWNEGQWNVPIPTGFLATERPKPTQN